MDVDEVYQYSELEGDDAIRLIYLQPCEDLEARIECSLKDAILTEYGEDIGDHYIAISYVWGDKNDRRSILVDGKRLDITASLDSALRHVRDRQRVLRVWADGVCIDQTDVHDRNRQVRLMGDVYSIAQHTIIFLGTSSPECDAVLQLISGEARSSGPGGQRSSALIQKSSQLLDGYERIVEDEILSKPWFTRVWILQELVLSQNPWLQCGKYRVRWHVFCTRVLSSPFRTWKSNSRAILAGMNESRIKFRTASVESLQTPEEFLGSSLLELLRTRRGCALTDPRDMIYAHLGLVSHEAREGIPVDYDRTVAQVYESIACFYIECAGLKTALSLVDYVQPENRPDHLSSWVTDW
ncbi:HET-domain-containing protein, partial [Stipitochalara longipes BDJ]